VPAATREVHLSAIGPDALSSLRLRVSARERSSHDFRGERGGQSFTGIVTECGPRLVECCIEEHNSGNARVSTTGRGYPRETRMRQPPMRVG